MKPSSAKQKGRNFEDLIASDIRLSFGLTDDDVRRNPASCTGTDIILSSKARLVFPFAIECKNRERLEIWSAIEQAEKNASKDMLVPLVVFKRNRSNKYAVITWEMFLWLIKQGNIRREATMEAQDNVIPQRIR